LGGSRAVPRTRRPAFDTEEARFVTEINAMVAEGFRTALLIGTISTADTSEAPGIVLFDDDGTV
jgi:hypothetical protein